MKQKEKHTYMLVWNNPLCCDKVYEIVFCTPMKTWLLLLNGEGLVRQNEKDFKAFIIFFIHQLCQDNEQQQNGQITKRRWAAQCYVWLSECSAGIRVLSYNHLSELPDFHTNNEVLLVLSQIISLNLYCFPH